MSVQRVLLCSFHCKPRPSGVSLESPGLENIPQVLGNRAEIGQGGLGYSMSLKVKLDYLSAPRLEIERLKKFCSVYFAANKGIQELV